MSHSLSVEVLNSDGDPVEGATVKVHITMHGAFGMKGGDLPAEETDDSGHAEFETSQDYADDAELTIRVRGQEFGPYDIGTGSYTVTLD